MTFIIDLIFMSIHEYCDLDTKKLDVIIVRRSTTIIGMKNSHWLFPVSSETGKSQCEFFLYRYTVITFRCY